MKCCSLKRIGVYACTFNEIDLLRVADLVLYDFCEATRAHRNAVYFGHCLFASTIVATLVV